MLSRHEDEKWLNDPIGGPWIVPNHVMLLGPEWEKSRRQLFAGFTTNHIRSCPLCQQALGSDHEEALAEASLVQ